MAGPAQDFFPTYEMKPNPSCSNAACRDRQVRACHKKDCRTRGFTCSSAPQAKRQAFLASPEYCAAQAAEAAALLDDTAAPLHADNEWNISVIGTPVRAQQAQFGA